MFQKYQSNFIFSLFFLSILFLLSAGASASFPVKTVEPYERKMFSPARPVPFLGPDLGPVPVPASLPLRHRRPIQITEEMNAYYLCSLRDSNYLSREKQAIASAIVLPKDFSAALALPTDLLRLIFVLAGENDKTHEMIDPQINDAYLKEFVAVFKGFKSLRSLTLQNLEHVRDVSALRAFSTIILDHLPNVSDVSALSEVPILSLCRLNQITNVSSVATVPDLTLSRLYNLRDVSVLRHVQRLCLDSLPKIKDVSALKNVPHLALHNLPLVADVSALGRVKTLLLDAMPKVSDISALSGVRNLTLRSLPAVTDLSALGNVETLRVESLFNVIDFSALGNVQNLTLYNVSCVKDLSFLTPGRPSWPVRTVLSLDDAEKIRLIEVYKKRGFEALGNVPNLTLNKIHHLIDVSTLGRVTRLTLHNLQYVTDLSALLEVPNLILGDRLSSLMSRQKSERKVAFPRRGVIMR